MNEIKRYPVQPDEYTKEEAPYLYTALAEAHAAARLRLEPRPAGTIACFACYPLQHGPTARAWLKAGYVVER
ncbi:MAG: hypothetical protein K2L38_09335 [Dysosmobacter sp.]|nr:hypothetical protein [Dysosmobacter sp.]